jgi:type IV secretion system protein VirB5
MKKSILGVFLMFLSAGACAQIPVTVTTQITDSPMTLAEFASNMTRWAEQSGQMVQQIEQMRQQYESITGSRNLGEIFSKPELRNYLPDEWQSVYDSVKSGGYSGLSDRAQSIYNDVKVFDACASLKIADERISCESRAVKGAQDEAFALDAYDKAKARVNQIEQLMRQINETQDQKGIAELQARIAAEQAMIENEKTKLQLYQMVAAADDRLQQQRQHELNAKALSRRGTLKLLKPK